MTTPFMYSLPVRFADVDHAGIVYYPRFFHYFHITFEELWRARIGAHAYRDLLDREHLGFPSVRAECSYVGPLRFGDTAEVELSVARMGTTSITFHYRVFRAGEPRTACADGTVVCAIVDMSRFVAMPIPERIRQLLADLIE